jgi:hypothetical protein
MKSFVVAGSDPSPLKRARERQKYFKKSCEPVG